MRSVLRFACLWFALALVAGAAQASPRSDAVLDALRVGELLAIMETESAASGEELNDSMLGGSGGASWLETVRQINDAQRMERELRAAFAEAMPDEHTEGATAFLTSDQGEKIIELELSAREALLDPAIDDMNQAAMRELRESGDPRFAMITRFVEVNNLVDANVAGALTGNVAFLRGLRIGGFPGYERASDSDLIAEVWAREPELRSETEDWVYAYLTLAYGPLEDSDLETYIAFSETETGQALNGALFTAFDEVFTDASQSLGEAVARYLTAEEI
ncbi:MAG: DUF2059 domain-containing protein [Rhodobacteraceae bacterium]|nr:DUF2059 domain-containing protein [Paracoccaceae bacterium]